MPHVLPSSMHRAPS